MYLSHKNFLFGKILMTSFHVICGLDLPQSKILGTPINWRSPKKIFLKTFFFFLENTCACVLGPWPWPRAFLSLASRGSVLGKAVLGLGLGLGFFLCPWPWPWPRALCPRLHLCKLSKNKEITFWPLKGVWKYYHYNGHNYYSRSPIRLVFFF